uniref:YdcH family protein n=1 Tax=Stappia sp. TaxID=1870903 RepID=UPI003BAC92DF
MDAGIDGGQDDKSVRMELARLRQEHRDLDTAIDAMSLTGRSDALQLQRLKKKKLALKDRISTLEDKLLPDIIA